MIKKSGGNVNSLFFWKLSPLFRLNFFSMWLPNFVTNGPLIDERKKGMLKTVSLCVKEKETKRVNKVI